MDNETNILELKEKVKNFCEERDWDQYHNAKDLAIGIITEASELLEHFRFQSEDQVHKKISETARTEISEEIADIFFFILRITQRYDIDLSEALNDKIKKNGDKYPVDKVKGLNKKYSEY